MEHPVEDLVFWLTEIEEKAKRLSGQKLFYYYLLLLGWRPVDIARHRDVTLQSVSQAVREIYKKING